MQISNELREEIIALLIDHQEDWLRPMTNDNHPDIERVQKVLNVLCENDPPKVECIHTEEEPGTHWVESLQGVEVRVDCGCPCEECRDY